MRSRALALTAAGIGLCICSAATADDIDVVASFKPVHSLVAGVMAGVGEPMLLVKGNASPHDYALKPSDAAALEQADLVFWIGERFETFLTKPLKTLPAGGRAIALGEIDGLFLLSPREGGIWETHAHDEEQGEDREHAEGESTEQEHEQRVFDGHIWLDPGNAKLMVDAIAAALADRDPTHAAIYVANADALQAKLDQLDAELEVELAAVKEVPFIVFHDAYQYFETRYGLAGVGSITVNPDQRPGAKRLQSIRKMIASLGARCVFREPNFEPAVVETVIAGTAARIGVLDPEGAALDEGPEMFFKLMRGTADSLKACLAASS